MSYAEPDRAVVRTYSLVPRATVDDVLRFAAADRAFAGIDIAHAAVGVFGQPAAADQHVSDGDRVEIYRPLAVDPKTARRTRAREAQKKSQGRR